MKKIAFIPHKKRVEKHKLDYLRAIADTMDDPYQAEDGREIRGVQLKLANKCADLSGIPYWTFTDCCTDSLQIAVTTLTNIGDSIFSSKDIYVGKVNKIKPKVSSNGQKIEVKLGVNFRTINEVYILKDILTDELNSFQK